MSAHHPHVIDMVRSVIYKPQQHSLPSQVPPPRPVTPHAQARIVDTVEHMPEPPPAYGDHGQHVRVHRSLFTTRRRDTNLSF
jgi:hypothetical protein